ncbi:MAG: RecX family transcriptional regulator [Bacteroidales bacterium]|nr:RecX family transcriptional regulator [Bacteroidales bacterium]
MQKITGICSLQEKCIFDVKQKLISWKLNNLEIEEIISKLVKDNFINEKRFAVAYANDKLKFNNWGKTKIRYALKEKKISDENIQIALNNISEGFYEKIIKNELLKKYKTLKKGNQFEIKAKLLRFGASKGYEAGMLYPIIDSIME